MGQCDQNIQLHVLANTILSGFHVYVPCCVCAHATADGHECQVHIDVKIVQFAEFDHCYRHHHHYDLWRHSHWLLPHNPPLPYAHEAILSSFILHISICFYLPPCLRLHTAICTLHTLGYVILVFDFYPCLQALPLKIPYICTVLPSASDHGCYWYLDIRKSQCIN